MNLKTFVTGIILVSASSFAIAGESAGPYIGGNFGFTSFDTKTEMQQTVNEIVALGYTSASMTMDQKSSGFKILGGYQINESVAVEGYWANLGTYNYTLATTGPTLSGSGSVKVTAIGIDLVGMLPFSPEVSGIARIGAFQFDAKDTFSLFGGSSSSSTTTGSNAKFGLGAEWKVSPSIRLRTEWEYYKDDQAPIGVLSLGIVSRF